MGVGKAELEAKAGIQVLLYTRQPFVAVGVSSVFGASEDFELVGCCESLAATIDCLRFNNPDIVLVHMTLRLSLAELGQMRSAGNRSRVVLWGDVMGGEFAFQAMQLGVRAILPSHMPIDGLLTSMLNVHRGMLCFEKELATRCCFKSASR